MATNSRAAAWKAAVALAALGAASAALAQNAATVIANASKSMGVDGLNSVTYYGSGANYNLGQNNNANYPWPRVNVNDYRRTIDFTQTRAVVDGSDVFRARHRRPGRARAVHAKHSEHEPGVGTAARDLGIAVGLPQGRGTVQRDVAAAHGRRRATDGDHLAIADQVAGRRRRIASSATSIATISSRASTRGSRTRCSATCWSRPSTPTIATTWGSSIRPRSCRSAAAGPRSTRRSWARTRTPRISPR